MSIEKPRISDVEGAMPVAVTTKHRYKHFFVVASGYKRLVGRGVIILSIE
jgi:hypothetical protein